MTNRLFGLTFKQNKEIKTWHQDVVAYEVYDASGKLMAIWYGNMTSQDRKKSRSLEQYPTLPMEKMVKNTDLMWSTCVIFPAY